MKCKKDFLKIIKEDYQNKFDNYMNMDEEEMEKYINKKLGELLILTFLQQLSLNDLLWDFDAMS